MAAKQSGNTPPPKWIVEDPRWLQARQWKRDVRPVQDRKYGWVTDFARDRWEAQQAIFGELDTKADAIIRYLGGGTGLFALGVLLRVDAKNVHVILAALPAVLAALAAVCCALWARWPGATPVLCTVPQAKELYADLEPDPEVAQCRFLGQWHQGTMEMRLVNRRKAANLCWASWWYFAALALLLVPVVVGLLWPPA